MTRTRIVLDAFWQDFDKAAKYQLRFSPTGDNVLAHKVDRAFERVIARPLLYRYWVDTMRRYVIPKSRYMIIYEADDTTVTIIGLRHVRSSERNARRTMRARIRGHKHPNDTPPNW
jgi:plasmid stabilization system protein ParE